MKIPAFDMQAQIRALRPELDAAIARTLDNCSFCLGPDVAAFEQDFAKYSGAAHSVGFNSGTSALHVGLLLLDIKPGDEIITTPFTFVATSWAISYVGAKPVYVDIDDATCNLDPAKVERAITPRTRAIMPVHLYGQSCDLAPLAAIAKKHQLHLIEDAAQAHGATYHGQPVGTVGVTAAFSFYPGKNLGACGEAGALIMADAALAERAKALREHGSKVRYYHDEVGFNYRMEGIQGAVLGVKLRHLAAWTAARRRIVARYTQLLKGTPLKLQAELPNTEGAWHLYVVRHARRDELRAYLEKQGVGTGLHYPVPLHLQKCYAALGYQAGDFPVAEAAARECLSLPLFPELTDAQIDYVVQHLKAFFKA
jgi:dTDP-4-amino-4,6-dideoxygalactose transaminase